MIKRFLFLLLVVAGALNAGAQSIDALQRTTTFTNTDLLLVQTNSAGAAGQKFSRSITASNFLENLKSFSNWTGGSGSATNAQPPSTVLTNLATSIGGSNRVMVSSHAVQITNAFKRFYFDTNVAHILSNLVASASSGDVVELGAGSFYIGVQSIRPPVGVTLKGQGRGVTFIYGDVGGTPATNPIVQLVSSNIIEDMTIVANKKGSYYQWPMGASTVWGNTAPTNVMVRRVELDGDTDCITVSHTDYTFGTLEDCYLHSGGDVFNLEGGYTPNVNGDQIGGTWTFRRTKFYSDASIIQQASWAANPIANAFQISNVKALFYDCEIIATNHKATAVLIVGGDTNRVELFNTVLSATGTNGYGYEVDDRSGFGETITDVIVHNTALVAATDIYGSPITTFRPTQVGSLNASAIKFVSGLASNSFLYLKADTNIAAGTFGSGLAFSGGTLTAAAQTNSSIVRQTELTSASNVLYSAISSGTGGTNNPVTLTGGPLTIIANQTARYYTNSGSSLFFTFSGTPTASAILSLAVSNSAASTIFLTNTAGFYDTRVGSNVTTLAVAAQSRSIFTFRRSATGDWVLEPVAELQATLEAGINTAKTTNGAAVSIVGMFSFSTNGTSWIQATNMVFRTPSNTALSNDASGTVSLHINASAGGGGPSTNSPPQALAINSGTGTTNIIINFAALLSTNYVRATLTANAGIIVTNIIDGKEITLELVQDSTGNRTISTSSVGGAPLRFGTDITGFGLSTNGTYLDKIRLHGSGTNAQVVGMLRGYAP
jgi:hypothetical protein